jgi:hypothetical protein
MESNYIVRTYLYNQLKGNVTMPTFQRSLVWNKERKKNFIKTVLSKNPFGVLLIYQNPETHKQQIIDGLQRFTTLQNFESNPLEYLDFEFDKKESFNQMIQLILNEYDNSTKEYLSTQIENIIKKIFKNHSVSDLNRDRLFINELKSNIFSIYPQIEDTATGSLLREEIYALWNEIKESLSINDIEIPIIIYKGSSDELPNIFERLNTGGTSLTKYEVFASTWSDVILKDIDLATAKIIEKRFSEVMDKTGMQIDNYSEGDIIANREITLYEYCFAMGKRIKETAPHLFGNKRNTNYDSVDSIGFSTIVTFLNMHLKNMSKLDKKINSSTNHRVLNKFTEKIISIYTELDSILSHHVSNYNKYIESQVISMAYTLFSIKYEFNADTLEIKEKSNTLDNLKKFQKNAAYRLFYDMLRNYWSGSGDNKLFEIVQAPLENNRYLLQVSEELYRPVLEEWANEVFEKSLKTVNSESKLFLSFLYAPLVKQPANYTLCHVIPKSILKEKNLIQGMNHIGNLYWLPKVAPFNKYKNDILYRVIKQNLIDQVFFYPKEDEISFVSSVYFEEDFLEFTKQRTTELIDLFLNQRV